MRTPTFNFAVKTEFISTICRLNNGVPQFADYFHNLPINLPISTFVGGGVRAAHLA